MKRKRHTPEQIIRKLRDADRILSEGKDIALVCQSWRYRRRRSTAGGTFCGGMKADEAKRLKALQVENGRLKKLVADQALDIQILKEVTRGNF